MVGESDSPGWASAKTDMTILKLDPSTGSAVWSKYCGGTGEDMALKVIGKSDGYLYTLGEGYSTEWTSGTIDIWLFRFKEDATLDYFYSFGGVNPDFGEDMVIYGSNVYIIG